MDDPVKIYCDLVGTGFNPRDMDEAHQKIIRALAAHVRREGMREAAMEGFNQYRVMLSLCYGAPHFVLSRDEIDKVATAMQKVHGSPKRQEELAADAILRAAEEAHSPRRPARLVSDTEKDSWTYRYWSAKRG